MTQELFYDNTRTYLISAGDGYLLFDTGWAGTFPKLCKALGEKGVKFSDIRYLLISHFHPDHMANLKKVKSDEIYLGANTFKYVKRGNIVETDLFIDDGVKIHLFPLPSSHAKGSVGLEAGRFAFLGDATYTTVKNGKVCYNSSVLKEEIGVLKNLSAKYFLISHDEKFIKTNLIAIIGYSLTPNKAPEPLVPRVISTLPSLYLTLES